MVTGAEKKRNDSPRSIGNPNPNPYTITTLYLSN